MDEFAAEIRNAAWWSSDTRRAIGGDAVNVVLEKQGKSPPYEPKIAEEELWRISHTMEPVIAKLIEHEIEIPVRSADYSATHPSEPWLKAHSDFLAGDALVECKNYALAHMPHFSEPDEPFKIPDADYFQCLHEATCFEVKTVYLAVLFGGQRFRYWKLNFGEAARDEFRKMAAQWWAHVANGTTPEPTTPEQCRAVWPRDTGQTITATRQVEEVANNLAALKRQIKQLEGPEAKLTAMLEQFMGTNAVLQDIAGRTLATWKTAKDSRSFDREAFQRAMPDLYEKFCVPKPGSRRFLLKGN
jgi:predicted phage-related endonuclease